VLQYMKEVFGSARQHVSKINRFATPQYFLAPSWQN